jgi:rod shape determining protein RodA
MRKLDLWLLLAALAISVGSYLAQGSTAKALATPGFANRQIVWLAVGGALLLLFAFTDYRVLARLSPFLYVASIGVLAAMFVVAPVRAGTHRWLLFGSFTIQPSDFARIATILAVAALAGEHRKDLLDLRTVARLAAMVGVPALLVLAQPDLGTAVTFGPILLAALWLGGLPWRAWAGLTLAGLVVVGCAWFWVLRPYQQERILTFVDPDRAPYSSGYQQRQSKIAVGSGEVTGKGLQSGTQSQLRFLPAQYTDFIFAVWAEETGFVGSALLLAAYALMVYRVFVIALSARDRVGAVFAGCAGAVLGTQILVNVGMVTGLAPTTGITLPLLSYGGSSVVATCIVLGILQSIWRLRYANV